ncbi:dipeptide epimerase [Sphingomonas sp. RT2P30]|uniref:dipeptide epimerase n=1 Tax=Parasphingomonas halimpatiens TaxID=3096162 RepID=UPI002FC5E63E
MDVAVRKWPMREPFAISRGVQDEVPGLCVTLLDAGGARGRGEACGVDYAGETPESMSRQIEGVGAEIEAGPSREDLLDLLPAGGARFAVDSALWDLEAKQSGTPAFMLAGLKEQKPVDTAFTIGIRPIADYEAAARARAGHRVLKLKVDGTDPMGAVRAARAGAPGSVFIVDPNQSWTVEQLRQFAPMMADLGVVLLEQPIRVGAEAGLDGYRCPIKLCADELIDSVADLAKAVGRFDMINIKLDKAGGLTAGIGLAAAARAQGLGVMVGCMAGSSLAMAPATILAQQADFVDLDGPLLQAEDWPHPLRYEHGQIFPPTSALWG